MHISVSLTMFVIFYDYQTLKWGDYTFVVNSVMQQFYCIPFFQSIQLLISSQYNIYNFSFIAVEKVSSFEDKDESEKKYMLICLDKRNNKIVVEDNPKNVSKYKVKYFLIPFVCEYYDSIKIDENNFFYDMYEK